MKYLILLAVILFASQSYGQVSDKARCVTQGMEALRQFLPAKYMDQMNRMIECKNANVTEICFRSAYGEPEPNSIEEALVAACSKTSYDRLMQQQAMMDCIRSSDELVYNIIVQSFKQWDCMFSALTSMEQGSLCQVRAEQGAEASVAFLDPIMVDMGLTTKINKVKRAIPESIAPCFNFHVVDLICDPASVEAMSTCLTEKVTMKSLKDFGKNLQRMNQRRRQELDPEVIRALFGNSNRRFPPSDPNDWTVILNNP